jgi:glycosyltransferase involved in cell wall biosynthesis
MQAGWIRNRCVPHAALLLETDQNILRKLPPPFQQMRRHMLKETDLLIGRCDEALDVSKACGYVGPTQIVEYGVDRTNFKSEGRWAARKELNVSDDVLNICYVGRLVPYKGLDEVLDAMVRAKNRNIILHVLGDGPDRKRFIARYRELGLAGQVKLYPTRPPNEVAQFIQACDLLVLMSRTTRTWKEQFGRVIMEAQACGVPVIGSDSGSIPSVIGPGGWVVPESDSVALAHLLDHVSTHPERSASTGISWSKAGRYQV